MKKKRILLFVLLFLLIFTLFGCKLVEIMRTNYPLWYYYPPVNKYQVYFIGTGSADIARQAELIAYMDIVEQLSNYLGYEPERSAYSELLSSGEIKTYSLSVRRRTVFETDNSYTSLILAVAKKSVIQDLRSKEGLKQENNIEKIISLVQEGDDYMKNSCDIEAVSCYMQSLALSYGLSSKILDKEYAFDQIFEEVVKILNSIQLKIVESNETDSTCTVQVTRKHGFMNSKVKESPIRADFVAIDGRNTKYSDYYIYYTSENGLFDYSVLNPSIVVTGSVYFSMNLNDEINALARVSAEKAQELRDLVSKKSIKFDYNLKKTFNSLVLSPLDYSEKGKYTPDENTGLHLSNLFENDGVKISLNIPAFDVNDDEIIKSVSLLYQNEEFLLITRTGTIVIIESSNGQYVASMEGKACLYRISTQELIWESEVVNAVAFEEDKILAEDMCRIRLENIIYSLLKGVNV